MQIKWISHPNFRESGLVDAKEVFKNDRKNGFPRKGRSLGCTKSMLTQKTSFLKTLRRPTVNFTQLKQSERANTDIFGSVFVIRCINMNGQKLAVFLLFWWKRAIWKVRSDASKRIKTKTEQGEKDLSSTAPFSSFQEKSFLRYSQFSMINSDYEWLHFLYVLYI